VIVAEGAIAIDDSAVAAEPSEGRSEGTPEVALGGHPDVYPENGEVDAP